nr:unnamed protein product [Callosobruchus analis]
MYNSNPPKPKYNYTWDPHPVLTKMAEWHPFDQLSLKQLTFKMEQTSTGTSSQIVTIDLPTSGCGVSLTSSPPEHGAGGVRMSYKVHLVVQQDRHLRQITDIERAVECQLPEEAFLVKSTPLIGVLREELKGGKIKHR